MDYKNQIEEAINSVCSDEKCEICSKQDICPIKNKDGSYLETIEQLIGSLIEVREEQIELLLNLLELSIKSSEIPFVKIGVSNRAIGIAAHLILDLMKANGSLKDQSEEETNAYIEKVQLKEDILVTALTEYAKIAKVEIPKELLDI